ncbi:MAG: hypothetical protein PUE65_07990 [Mollicutes bacterium]|nr:hypothetical protein [Mollicutes bacterium]
MSLNDDLVEAGKCSKEGAEAYIKNLTAHVFQDETLEYRLINIAKGIVNIAGMKKFVAQSNVHVGY